MHRGPRLAHDHGGGQAAPGDVADPDPGSAPAEVVDVPPVTADLDAGATGDVAGSDPQARQGRGDVRQQGALQVACDLALLVEGAQMGDRRAGAGSDVLQERHVGLRVGPAGVGTDQDDAAGDLPRHRERQHGDGVTIGVAQPLVGGAARQHRVRPGRRDVQEHGPSCLQGPLPAGPLRRWAGRGRMSVPVQQRRRHGDGPWGLPLRRRRGTASRARHQRQRGPDRVHVDRGDVGQRRHQRVGQPLQRAVRVGGLRHLPGDLGQQPGAESEALGVDPLGDVDGGHRHAPLGSPGCAGPKGAKT